MESSEPSEPIEIIQQLSKMPKVALNSTLKVSHEEEILNTELKEQSNQTILLTNESKTESKASEKKIDKDSKIPNYQKVEEEKYQSFRYSSQPDEFYENSDKNENDFKTIIKESILSQITKSEDSNDEEEKNESIHSGDEHESPLYKRKDIILECDEKNKMHIIATKNNYISIDMSNDNFSYNIQSFERNAEDTAVSYQGRTQRDSHLTNPLQFSTDILNIKERQTEQKVDNPFRMATDRYNSADVVNQISPRDIRMAEDKNSFNSINPRIGRSHSSDLILCFRVDSLNEVNIFEG
jgi:hypothetical protein